MTCPTPRHWRPGQHGDYSHLRMTTPDQRVFLSPHMKTTFGFLTEHLHSQHLRSQHPRSQHLRSQHLCSRFLNQLNSPLPGFLCSHNCSSPHPKKLFFFLHFHSLITVVSAFHLFIVFLSFTVSFSSCYGGFLPATSFSLPLCFPLLLLPAAHFQFFRHHRYCVHICGEGFLK